MRFRPSLVLLAASGAAAALSGCARPGPVETAAAPPNPYGYLRPAAVCRTPDARLSPTGLAQTTMVVGNDAGYCAVRFAQAAGGPYASFLVTEPPLHGDPLIYNYNGQTVVTYTPTTGYTGPDHMIVEFVPGPGQPRASLSFAITVQPGTPVARS